MRSLYINRVAQEVRKIRKNRFDSPHAIQLSLYQFNNTIWRCRNPSEIIRMIHLALGIDVPYLITHLAIFYRAGVDRVREELFPGLVVTVMGALTTEETSFVTAMFCPYEVLQAAFSIDTGIISREALASRNSVTHAACEPQTVPDGTCRYATRDSLARRIVAAFLSKSTDKTTTSDLMSLFGDVDWAYCEASEPRTLQVATVEFDDDDPETWLEHYTRMHGALLTKTEL